jgi:CheY-like chemotaxis protein
VARDGEEALDLLRGQGSNGSRSLACRPKVILLDLKLPKVNGLQVLKELKSDPLTQAIPVVILSSSNHEKDLAEGYRLGASSYVQKPTDFDEFRKMIRALRSYWLEVNQAPG